MPTPRSANAVRLEFAPGCLVRSNLSGAAFTGDWRCVGGDFTSDDRYILAGPTMVPISRRASTPFSVTCCAALEIPGPGPT